MGMGRAPSSHPTNTITQYTHYTIYPAPNATETHTAGGGEDVAEGQLNGSPEQSQAELLAAINGSRTVLETKIEALSIDVNLLRIDLRKVADKVEMAESNITELQGEVTVLKQQMAQMTTATAELELRMEDAEGCSFRSIIRVLGFPEKVEGTAPEQFPENWVRVELKPPGLAQFIVVERAHRALVPPPPSVAAPGGFFGKILN